MPIPKVKKVVSSEGIEKEIEKTREKLASLEKNAKSPEREAIVRQMLQLEVCEQILHDFFLIP
jgi:hypothetical protein